MAKVSRFKQPAFDPAEIDDLIHIPAVGSGVGSHLLTGEDQFPAPTILKNKAADPSHLTTVDRLRLDPTSQIQSTASIVTKLDEMSRQSSNLSTVVMPMSNQGSGFMSNVEDTQSYVSTVDRSEITTVDRSEDNLKMSTVANHDMTTVARSKEGDLNTGLVSREDLNMATVPMFEDSGTDMIDGPNLSTVAISKLHLTRPPLWITEAGDLIPQGRVKRIQLAQDVVNSAEESVYDELWKVKGAVEIEDARIVQAGYDYLAKRTRLARKTIQRIIAKLIAKDFIAIERPADIYERSSTFYRVFSYRTVLERHKVRGRTHVAKVGPGFCYVHRVNDLRERPQQSDLTTVATSDVTTVDLTPTVTGVNNNLSTVVRETTINVGNSLGTVPSSSLVVQNALAGYGTIDDDVCLQLIQRCRLQAKDCSDEEIASYVHEKGRLVRSAHSTIRNPIGFFLESVPKCFASKQYRDWREARERLQTEQAEHERREQRELEEWRRDQEARLADPDVPEDDKRLIRKWIGAGSSVLH